MDAVLYYPKNAGFGPQQGVRDYIAYNLHPRSRPGGWRVSDGEGAWRHPNNLQKLNEFDGSWAANVQVHPFWLTACYIRPNNPSSVISYVAYDIIVSYDGEFFRADGFGLIQDGERISNVGSTPGAWPTKSYHLEPLFDDEFASIHIIGEKIYYATS